MEFIKIYNNQVTDLAMRASKSGKYRKELIETQETLKSMQVTMQEKDARIAELEAKIANLEQTKLLP